MRGCLEKKVLTLQQLGDWDAVAPCPHSRTEFQYQIPNSFKVRGAELNRVLTRVVRTQIES